MTVEFIIAFTRFTQFNKNIEINRLHELNLTRQWLKLNQTKRHNYCVSL